jgi:hypothetical protein
VESYPLKSNRTGASSTLAKGPTVGGKTRRTGAVWSISFYPLLSAGLELRDTEKVELDPPFETLLCRC